MTKAELIKALKDYPDEEEVLVNVSPLYDGEATWHNIEHIDTIIPATIMIEKEPCMY